MSRWVGFFLLFAVAAVSAKGPTVAVTIAADHLPAAITIDDLEALSPFQVWAGAGVTVNGAPQAEGFIIDWRAGAVPEPPARVPRYQLTFHATRASEPALPPRPVYVVTYAHDPGQRLGYVYLPGKDSSHWTLNSGSIRRGVEGQWFRATTAWIGVMTTHLP